MLYIVIGIVAMLVGIIIGRKGVDLCKNPNLKYLVDNVCNIVSPPATSNVSESAVTSPPTEANEVSGMNSDFDAKCSQAVPSMETAAITSTTMSLAGPINHVVHMYNVHMGNAFFRHQPFFERTIPSMILWALHQAMARYITCFLLWAYKHSFAEPLFALFIAALVAFKIVSVRGLWTFYTAIVLLGVMWLSLTCLLDGCLYVIMGPAPELDMPDYFDFDFDLEVGPLYLNQPDPVREYILPLVALVLLLAEAIFQLWSGLLNTIARWVDAACGVINNSWSDSKVQIAWLWSLSKVRVAWHYVKLTLRRLVPAVFIPEVTDDQPKFDLKYLVIILPYTSATPNRSSQTVEED
jgi:hypothetical protein